METSFFVKHLPCLKIKSMIYTDVVSLRVSARRKQQHIANAREPIAELLLPTKPTHSAK